MVTKRRPTEWVPLSVNYVDDPKIVAAGPEAELFYIRVLAYCGRMHSDGFITDEQVRNRLDFTDPTEQAKRCIEVGLLERLDGGLQVSAWRRWNLTERQQSRTRAQDRNRKAGLTSQKGGIGDTHSRTSRSDSAAQEQEQEQEQEREHKQKSRSRGDHNSDPIFARFWAVYPRRIGKPDAFKAWKAALKAKADPEAIIAAAARYRDSPGRKPEYTKHPGPWLRDERWNDQPVDESPEDVMEEWQR